ncbi:TBC1 domain family member 22B-like isoform X3 [Huso huso]|uniref:TBC1 domain family member 22B-like isoform X3 n=1 Tax=Huso huso TaxID=61971 RepID=A0ABR0YHI5_HUSHU
MATDNKIQFWKRNAKVPGSLQPVYGAQHPPLDPRIHKTFLKEAPKTNALSIKSKKASSFLEFARSTSDAWDIGDDEEEEFLGGPPPNTPPNLNSKVAVATAAQVIHNYNKVREKPEWPQSTERVQANGSVVKSNSAAQLSQPSDGSSFRKPLHKQQSLPLRPVIPLIARISDQNASGAPPMAVREKTRLEKFRQLLASQNTDLEELRRCSWSGIPREFRPITWRLLSGYLPANMERREIVLKRKRDEYFGFIEQYYDSRNEEHHQDTYRQVFERILFIWAIRHPASGYVQGINDLVTPFFVVFLSEFVGKSCLCVRFNHNVFVEKLKFYNVF